MGKKLDDKDKNNFQNLADELKPREQMASLPSVTMMSSSSLLAIMLGHGVNGINVLELSNRLITAFGSATELAKADWRRQPSGRGWKSTRNIRWVLNAV